MNQDRVLTLIFVLVRFLSCALFWSVLQPYSFFCALLMFCSLSSLGRSTLTKVMDEECILNDYGPSLHLNFLIFLPFQLLEHILEKLVIQQVELGLVVGSAIRVALLADGDSVVDAWAGSQACNAVDADICTMLDCVEFQYFQIRNHFHLACPQL